MARYVHHLPGRIRYKFPDLPTEKLIAVGKAVEHCRDVDHVELRPRSRSLIVHYNPERTDMRRLGLCIDAELRTISKTMPADVTDPKLLPISADSGVFVQSVRHVGMVFGKTAFKVALEQAVRGGLNSLYKSTLTRS